MFVLSKIFFNTMFHTMFDNIFDNIYIYIYTYIYYTIWRNLAYAVVAAVCHDYAAVRADANSRRRMESSVYTSAIHKAWRLDSHLNYSGHVTMAAASNNGANQ